MATLRPLDKDLYALRHRAQELSKGIAKAMQRLSASQRARDWKAALNEFSVIASQLRKLQGDVEKGVGSQLAKFTLQPSHARHLTVRMCRAPPLSGARAARPSRVEGARRERAEGRPRQAPPAA